MIFLTDNPMRENFVFPNGMSLKLTYCIKDDQANKIFEGFGRLDAHLRKARLYYNEEVINEVIEENPDYIHVEEQEKLKEKNLPLGDEFEKVIKFSDGKEVKVEYWVTPTKRDKKCGRYYAKYRKIILFDEKGEIISEVMGENPNYFDERVHVWNDTTGIII